MYIFHIRLYTICSAEIQKHLYIETHQILYKVAIRYDLLNGISLTRNVYSIFGYMRSVQQKFRNIFTQKATHLRRHFEKDYDIYPCVIFIRFLIIQVCKRFLYRFLIILIYLYFMVLKSIFLFFIRVFFYIQVFYNIL